MQILIVFALLGYVCGSIPFGKLAGRAVGIDIQKRGSGNIGFANAVRVLGWKLGALVLVGDVAKGFMPTLAAYEVGGLQLALITGLAAIIGHVYPVWLRFKGGKAIATGLGVLAVIFPLGAAVGLATYILTFSYTKKSDIGSLVAVWAVVLAALLTKSSLLGLCVALALFAMFTHRSNIKKYLVKTENQSHDARA